MVVETAQILSTARWFAAAQQHNLIPWKCKHSDLWRQLAAIHREEAGLDPGIAFALKLSDVRKVTAQSLPDSLYAQIYSPTHINHPSSVWARSSRANYRWLSRLGLELCYEYTRRYGRRHKTQIVIELCSANTPNIFPDQPFEEPPQCMPDDSKVPGDSVAAYRQYYIKHKAYMARWNHSQTPNWWPRDESQT